MLGQKRIRDYGIKVGRIETGPRNSITDIEGVKVGHVTINSDQVRTGVTAVIPHEGNTFLEKVSASCHVINGFGKSAGLVQIEELGTLETPLILTNTFSVGTSINALLRYMFGRNPDIGASTGTVNPVIMECNDGFLNDIRGLHVKEEHILKALEDSELDFLEGSVGGGTGMSCYQLKGGIGTSSRKINLDRDVPGYTLGVLVQSNFGKFRDLTVNGRRPSPELIELAVVEESSRNPGSIIVIIATDLPLSERQLKRVCRRASVGISRTGSYMENGSGEIALAFTTHGRIPHYRQSCVIERKVLHEDLMDRVFEASVEAVEEAILNSMICADPVTGREGNSRTSLKQWIHRFL